MAHECGAQAQQGGARRDGGSTQGCASCAWPSRCLKRQLVSSGLVPGRSPEAGAKGLPQAFACSPPAHSRAPRPRRGAVCRCRPQRPSWLATLPATLLPGLAWPRSCSTRPSLGPGLPVAGAAGRPGRLLPHFRDPSGREGHSVRAPVVAQGGPKRQRAAEAPARRACAAVESRLRARHQCVASRVPPASC